MCVYIRQLQNPPKLSIYSHSVYNKLTAKHIKDAFTSSQETVCADSSVKDKYVLHSIYCLCQLETRLYAHTCTLLL